MQRKTAALVVFLTLVAACGASRDAVLARTATGLDAAYKLFQDEDLRRQRQIRSQHTEAEGAPILAAHQAARDKINVAFVVAASALAAASFSPSDLNVSRLVTLAAAAYEAFRGWKP